MRVLFIDIDTLRADHMGCYGYLRNTTPNLDSIAAEGIRFNNYYCSDAPCLPSRASLISGMFGIRSGAVGHGGTAADRRLTGNPFENDPLPEWITEDVLKEHLKHVGPHSLNEINMYDDYEDPRFPRYPGKVTDMKGLRRLMDGYDCGIRYADYLIGQVIDLLKKKGVYDDVAIIITSDHGESMGELGGIYSEHATADNSTCRVPMIIKWPGGKKNFVDNELHYNLDLCPTMADLLGVQPSKKWDGSSFANTIITGEPQGHEYLVLSQMAHVCQRSVRFGDWIYIRTYHDGYHLFPKEMLFNLKTDPYEQNNVAENHPEICNKAARMLLDWHDEMMLKSDSEIDPMWTVMKEGVPFHAKGKLKDYLLRLESTGRSEGAAQLRKKYLD